MLFNNIHTYLEQTLNVREDCHHSKNNFEPLHLFLKIILKHNIKETEFFLAYFLIANSRLPPPKKKQEKKC